MKRHPCSAAYTAWINEPSVAKLFADSASGKYLANRLQTAFEQGWFAAERTVKAALSEPRSDDDA